MSKPLAEWTVEELRAELGRIGDELGRRAATPVRKREVDVVRACENWIRGYAWDETFTLEMVREELALHERKVGQTLSAPERDRLLELWASLHAERGLKAA